VKFLADADVELVVLSQETETYDQMS